MRSLVLDFDRREIAEAEIDEPRIEAPNQVLFRVHEVGVCGTDRELAAFRLMPRPGDARRIVIGHEALGQVIEAGAGVSGLTRGDWVVPAIRRGCRPACASCRSGRSDLCMTRGYSERGIHNLDGYFTEFAVDDASDLVSVPERLVPFAVLLEPLSVVERAIGRLQELDQTGGRRALVLGIGPIGMLAAMALRLRGYEVTIFSQEPEDHPRVASMRGVGAAYTRSLDGHFDAIIEAAGSAELALAALGLLGPCGVFVALGARKVYGEISFIDLIVGNQTVAGVVNASRWFFDAGAVDLAAMPEPVLRSMIRRFGFTDYRLTLFGSPATEPKFVHAIADSLH